MVEGMSREQLYADLAAFARSFKAFRLPPLKLQRIGGFLALCLSDHSQQLDTLAAGCVARFDRFRQPPTSEERARRSNALSPRQKMLLSRWGYPYVMEEWRFHVTLTGHVDDQCADVISAFLTDFLDEVLREVMWVRDLCVYVESGDGADFQLAMRFPLS